jgi:hypothetical protein
MPCESDYFLLVKTVSGPDIEAVAALHVQSGLRTVCAGGDPGLDERSELNLRAGRRQTSLARMPRPPNESVRCNVFVDFRETAPAVARAILQLQTDFT